MDVDIKQLQNKLLEMLKDFDSFCKENRLTYSISYGTLLGAVRHKGFIPWDDDLDVVMPRKDYDTLLKIFKSNEKYTLQEEKIDYPLYFSKIRCNNTTFIEEVPYRRKYRNINQGVFIDVFPLDNVYDERFKAMLQVFFSNILISQSLLKRGYPKSHMTLKKMFMFIIAFLLLPFSSLFDKFVKSANKDNSKYITSFFGEVKKVYIEKSDFEDFSEQLVFEDIKLMCFKNYKQFLNNMYGDYMKLPSEEEIKYTIHAKFVDLAKDYTEYLGEMYEK